MFMATVLKGLRRISHQHQPVAPIETLDPHDHDTSTSGLARQKFYRNYVSPILATIYRVYRWNH